MKRIVILVLILGTGTGLIHAAPACQTIRLRSQVTIPEGPFTLADLLAPLSCADVRRRAAQVSLGLAPRAGIVRILDASQIRPSVQKMGEGLGASPAEEFEIPQRIEIRRTEEIKSCDEIAEVIMHFPHPVSAKSNELDNPLDCGAARRIPRAATLELLRMDWDPWTGRREFTLRCSREQDCLPFFVWAKGEEFPTPPFGSLALRRPEALQEINQVKRLVRPGDTATLLWDQGGIRVMVPVICIDAGGSGQFVRVRLKNASRTLRAEVIGAGSVRIGL